MLPELTVLVADDDPVVLDSCRRVLEAEGCTVLLASGARRALELLAGSRVGLLLVDVIMPEYDGIHLIDSIRAEHAQLPIVVMSGYPTPETAARGFRAGASQFLAKPFTPQELLEAVGRALGSKEGRKNQGATNQ